MLESSRARGSADGSVPRLRNEMGHAVYMYVNMVNDVGAMILTYNNCEENICAYNLENFLGVKFIDDTDAMNDHDLQDSGHI